MAFAECAETSVITPVAALRTARRNLRSSTMRPRCKKHMLVLSMDRCNKHRATPRNACRNACALPILRGPSIFRGTQLRSIAGSNGLLGLLLAAVPPMVLAVDAVKQLPIVVKATKNDEKVALDARFTVQAPIKSVWAVLTDFDHMTSFLPNFEVSKIMARDGDQLQVTQKGKQSFGLIDNLSTTSAR